MLGGVPMATDKIQTGIRLEEAALIKLRYIAKEQRRTLNSLAEYLFDCEIKRYESEHGAIPVDLESD